MTTDSSYLELDDMKPMRVCFLKATREAYWKTFSEGRITKSTINVLMGSVDEAIDLATHGLHDWNYISTHIKFPEYYKFFSTSVCPQRLTRFFVLKKLQNSCHICSAFIHAHRIARQLLLHYTGDNGNAATVIAESEAEEVEAQKFLEDVKNTMPEIIHQTEARQVTFSMLKCLDECLNDMEKDAILSEKVVLHVHESLQESAIAISKFLAPDIFEKFSMQEVRRIIDESSIMNTFSSQEIIETSHHSTNVLLSGCLRDQRTEQLIECPAILPCSILNESVPYASANVMGWLPNLDAWCFCWREFWIKFLFKVQSCGTSKDSSYRHFSMRIWPCKALERRKNW